MRQKLFVYLLMSLPIICVGFGLPDEKNHAFSDESVIGDVRKARVFLEHLLARDEESIVKYLGKSRAFHSGDKLNQEIYDFLYRRKMGEEWKSVLEIASLGSLGIKIVPQGSNVITVLYFPTRFQTEIEDERFLVNEWMKKYFACEFEAVGDGWEFYQNVCFAETDGPFPPEYG